MVIAAMLAGAVAVGAPPVVVGLATLAAVEPRLAIGGIGLWLAYRGLTRERKPGADAEAAFLRAVAGELRAGTSLRIALADAAETRPLGLERAARLARAGAPMDRVAAELGTRLRHNGVATAAAVELSAWSGATVAGVFEGLAERAAEAAELLREQRVATTQARLGAWVVGLAPLAFSLLLLATGGLESMRRAGTAGALIVGTGVALEIAGLLIVMSIIRRARR